MEFLPWCIDPYVKIYLLFNGQRIAKKKTHVKKRTLNPVFNESFVFELPHMEEGLKNISLEFMLLDWDRVTKNEVRIFQVWLKKVLKKKKNVKLHEMNNEKFCSISQQHFIVLKLHLISEQWIQKALLKNSF